MCLSFCWLLINCDPPQLAAKIRIGLPISPLHPILLVALLLVRAFMVLLLQVPLLPQVFILMTVLY